MLPSAARLRRREDFAAAIRHGRRSGKRTVVVHLLARGDRFPDGPPDGAAGEVTKVGFVVSRAVGHAVTRHRVLRRLRHLMRSRLDDLPDGALVVVRALPPAAEASSRRLGRDIDAALARLGVR